MAVTSTIQLQHKKASGITHNNRGGNESGGAGWYKHLRDKGALHRLDAKSEYEPYYMLSAVVFSRVRVSNVFGG
jgi:hypothetical protein